MISNSANIKKMLDAQQAAINANVDAKQVAVNNNVNAKIAETKAEVVSKATATQNAIIEDGDVTQAKLDALTTVNGDISTDVQAINAHVTLENDRVLANIPSSSPVESIQPYFTNYLGMVHNAVVKIPLNSTINVGKSRIAINRFATNLDGREGMIEFSLEPDFLVITNTNDSNNADIDYLDLEVIEYA